jgi:hypothetical protein
VSFALIHAKPRPPDPIAGTPKSVWRTEEGEITTSFHPAPSGFLVRVVDCADYAIDFTARTVVCTPWPGADQDIVEGAFANQIGPLLRTWDGDLVIHASSVVIEGRAVGFFGLSRRGKSTLATALSRAGNPCVTDDGLILIRTGQGFVAEPKIAPLRLLPDSEAALLGKAPMAFERDTKARIDLPGDIVFQQGTVPLGALYHLGAPDADRLAIAPLDHGVAMDAVLKQTFMLDTGDKARMRAHFDCVAFLAETVPIFSLDYPRDYDQLPAVVDGIIAHVREIVSQPDALR